MNTRMISILQHLLAADAPVKSEHLAKLIQVTSRTVRNDIRELDEFLAGRGATIEPVRSRGYELKIHDDRAFKELLQQLFSYHEPDDPGLPEYRQLYLIRRLLLAGGYLKLEDLADELYVSRSTVQNDFREVKKTLQLYEVSIDARPNYGVRLEGSEVRLRFCMSEFVVNRSGGGTASRESGFASIVTPQEMTVIQSIILEQTQKFNVVLSDIAFSNLVTHIAIACRRIREGNQLCSLSDELEHFRKMEEYEASRRIVSLIEKELKLLFPEAEIAYIAMHLGGTRWFNEISAGGKEETDVEKLIDREIYELGKEIIEEIERELNLGIKEDQELFMGICLHLKPALNRIRYSMSIRNPLLDQVKTRYPLAFQAGVIAAKLIESKMNTSIPEAEMGYLAIHIGAAMERSPGMQRPKRCLVVCTSGVGSARLLYYKLKSKFGSQLEIAGTTEYYKLKQLSLENIDFLVSTIPIKDPLPVPVVVVETLLGDGDLHKIRNLLTEEGEVTFRYVMEELVFLRQNFTSRKEVISFLGAKIHDMGLVQSAAAFVGLVLEREQAAPTSYGNLVAIPHPITPQSSRTVWAICTLEQPIDWAGKPVQFVCLLSISRNGADSPTEMYDQLIRIADSPDMIRQLLDCENFSEFSRMIVKHRLY
ncbi:BglG family transcription antiterminator [Paenibacillus medicaginis]|uniref:BglG family transcription antiterminator n=1 Tax=Paenibacillus medicaginis TaxID=1470560 RepID=A0ABV5C3J8_9BACL